MPLGAAPRIGPYVNFAQLLGPSLDLHQGDICRGLDRELATDDPPHEWGWVVYLAVLLLEDLTVVCVSGCPVCLQIILTITPPWAEREGTKDPMR